MRAGVVGREVDVVGRWRRRFGASVARCGFVGRLLRRLAAGFGRSAPRRSFGASTRDDQVALAQLAAPARPLRPAGPRSLGPAVSRSMTTSMLCRICRSSCRSSVSGTTVPSTRARTKPCLSRSSNRSRYSPFLRRGSAARAPRTACPSGSWPMRSMICSRVWAVIGRRALRAMPLPGAGVEHAQIIVNLGDRADRRARVLARRLLRDRNRRAQARDEIDVRLGHLPQKLPGEARQAFDVAPLPFGIQRVEGQRAFARAADAGQANQLIARQGTD